MEGVKIKVTRDSTLDTRWTISSQPAHSFICNLLESCIIGGLAATLQRPHD